MVTAGGAEAGEHGQGEKAEGGLFKAGPKRPFDVGACHPAAHAPSEAVATTATRPSARQSRRKPFRGSDARAVAANACASRRLTLYRNLRPEPSLCPNVFVNLRRRLDSIGHINVGDDALLGPDGSSGRPTTRPVPWSATGSHPRGHRRRNVWSADALIASRPDWAGASAGTGPVLGVTQCGHPMARASLADPRIPSSGTESERTKGGNVKLRVFLSYAHADHVAMRRVLRRLSDEGFDVWTDRNLEPGTQMWEDQIQGAIESASAIVVLLTPSAKASAWVRKEISYALARGVRILPLLASGTEASAIPLSLMNVQYVDIRYSDDGIARLRKAVEKSQPLAPPRARAHTPLIVPVNVDRDAGFVSSDQSARHQPSRAPVKGGGILGGLLGNYPMPSRSASPKADIKPARTTVSRRRHDTLLFRQLVGGLAMTLLVIIVPPKAYVAYADSPNWTVESFCLYDNVGSIDSPANAESTGFARSWSVLLTGHWNGDDLTPECHIGTRAGSARRWILGSSVVAYLISMTLILSRQLSHGYRKLTQPLRT